MLDYTEPRRVAREDLQAITKEAEYLNKLPPIQLRRLMGASTEKQFTAGSVLVSEGSDIEEVHLILRGMVSVGLYEASNPAMWLYVSGPGTIVDMFALLEPPVSPVSVRALSDVDALSIPREVLLDVMKEEASVACEVLRALCTRMSIINRVTLQELSQEWPGPSRN